MYFLLLVFLLFQSLKDVKSMLFWLTPELENMTVEFEVRALKCGHVSPVFPRQSDVRKRGHFVPMFTAHSDVAESDSASKKP